jgi:hypothetical protein
VRITQGPLQGVAGILVQGKLVKRLLILSVDLLQRSVAVEIGCRAVKRLQLCTRLPRPSG